MKIELHFPKDGKSWPIGDTCVIGRDPGADVQLLDPNVSRKHASLSRMEDGQYYFNDLRSANGSRVNGVFVTSQVRLRHGDQIFIADNLLVVTMAGFEPFETRQGSSGDDTMMIGMQRVPMTFLVADLEGFTVLAAQVTEEELAVLMAPWYEECRRLLRPGGATIDKFIGDCVFAYWRNTDHDSRAAALAAGRALAAYAVKVPTEVAVRLREKGIRLQCGVGLHIGEAAVGAIAPGMFSVLGDAVNLTFRIEALTRKLETPVLASRAFLEGWPEGEAAFTSLGAHPLKGIQDPVEVFRLRA